MLYHPSSWSQELFLNFRKAFLINYNSTLMTTCTTLPFVVKLSFKINQPIYYLNEDDFNQAIELLVSSLALANSATLIPANGLPVAAIRVDGEDTLL